MTTRSAAVNIAALALGVLLSPAFAAAQTSFGALGGKVTDEQGAFLPGATIVVRHLETNTTRSGTTEARGQYFLPNLPAGRYELTVELQGFASAKREFVLRVGQEAALDVTLTVAAVAETVLVSGVSALVETQATVGSLIDRQAIDALPTLNRDFAELAKLAPGVTSTGQSSMGFSASGQRQFQNNVFVDGATNAMQFYGTQSESYPQDWIQEFQVMTNGFSAEFGQASGAVLNVITKSGSNSLQGRGYGFVRDDNFDTAPVRGSFRQRRTAVPGRAAAVQPAAVWRLSRRSDQERLHFLPGRIRELRERRHDGPRACRLLAQSRTGDRDSVEEHHTGAPAERRLERQPAKSRLAAT